MKGLSLYDGHRHLFIPVDGPRPLDAERAMAGLASPTLARIVQVGQEPEPGYNTAPAMRLVAAEIERRVANDTFFVRAEETAAQVHMRRRWIEPVITNYGRTV